jgi:hypothetical protein
LFVWVGPHRATAVSFLFNDTLASVCQASAELQQALHELKQYPSGFMFGTPPPAKGVVPGD